MKLHPKPTLQDSHHGKVLIKSNEIIQKFRKAKLSKQMKSEALKCNSIASIDIYFHIYHLSYAANKEDGCKLGIQSYIIVNYVHL